MRGVEALIRWRHPTRGWLAPNSFLDLAERHGLIRSLDRWVIRAAGLQLCDWNERGRKNLYLAINLSSVSLGDPGLAEELLAILLSSGVDATQMCVEVTEGDFATSTRQVAATLEALRAKGIRTALDDFGTGFSSLDRLRQLPFDIVKVDRSFVADIETDPAALAMTRAIVQLSSNLGMTVVAEGVETSGQLELLRDIGCPGGPGPFTGPSGRRGSPRCSALHNADADGDPMSGLALRARPAP